MQKIKDAGSYGIIRYSDGKEFPLITPEKLLQFSGHNSTPEWEFDNDLALLLQQTLRQAAEDDILLDLDQIRLTSATRNYIPKGGATNSQHMKGKAFDFHFSKRDLLALKKDITQNPSKYKEFGGIGFYDTYLHFDSGIDSPTGKYAPYFRFWDKSKKKTDWDILDNTEKDEHTEGRNLFYLLIAILGIYIITKK
jgi:hypothetical protein